MACAGMFHLTGEEFYLAWAERTFEFLDCALGDSIHGGYEQSIPPSAPRGQNPHMHLFEACMYAFEATGMDQYLDRAARLYDLFARKFFNAERCAVGEFFKNDWSNDIDGPRRRIDPGHQFEWVWLLDRYAKLTGGRIPERDAIFEFALTHGSDLTDLLVYEEIDLAGYPVRATKRMWSQTEKLKALIVQYEIGNPVVTPELITELLENGLGRYLQRRRGTWIDVIGRSAGGDVLPASTLYHFGPWERLDQYTKLVISTFVRTVAANEGAHAAVKSASPVQSSISINPVSSGH
jgi:mannose/cellobiose epimerase-like protein (N-acyl-D-glucosamine 2-epimerase family)